MPFSLTKSKVLNVHPVCPAKKTRIEPNKNDRHLLSEKNPLRHMKLFITISVLVFSSSQASAEWTCKENERCQEYQSCILDGQISQCSYSSGSAVSGGVKFADGSDFFIEWVSSGDQDMELTLQEQGFALVDGVKTRFWQTEPDCIEFEATDQKPSFGYGVCSAGR